MELEENAENNELLQLILRKHEVFDKRWIITSWEKGWYVVFTTYVLVGVTVLKQAATMSMVSCCGSIFLEHCV